MKRIFHTTPAPYVQNKRCKDRCRSLHLVFSNHSPIDDPVCNIIDYLDGIRNTRQESRTTLG